MSIRRFSAMAPHNEGHTQHHSHHNSHYSEDDELCQRPGEQDGERDFVGRVSHESLWISSLLALRCFTVSILPESPTYNNMI